MATKVLLPIDGQRNSRDAEAYAVELNRKLPVEVLLLFVVDDRELDWHGINPDFKETVLQTKRRIGEKVLADVAEAFKTSGIPFEKKVLVGNPGVQICQVAQDEAADMVVMSESGRAELKDWSIGSVVNHVIHRCRVPVLLVKHPQD